MKTESKMKRLLMSGAVMIAALEMSACATTAQTTDGDMASAAQQERPVRRRGGGGHSKDAFLEGYDLDGDGRVSEAEFYAARDQGYDLRDMDRDGGVAPDEYVAEYEGRLDQDLAEQRDRQLKQAYVRFDVLDDDKDGVMTREEFRNSGKRMFDRLDTNGDGVVDQGDTTERY